MVPAPIPNPHNLCVSATAYGAWQAAGMAMNCVPGIPRSFILQQRALAFCDPHADRQQLQHHQDREQTEGGMIAD